MRSHTGSVSPGRSQPMADLRKPGSGSAAGSHPQPA